MVRADLALARLSGPGNDQTVAMLELLAGQ